MTKKIVHKRAPNRNDLTADYVRSILDYNPETGVFVWKHRDDVPNHVNVRLAGKTAGVMYEGGYIKIKIHDKHYAAHRLAWLYKTGEWPKDEVDHRDTKRNNNGFMNLREATLAKNQMNTGTPKNNKSGYKGVSWWKKQKRWVAQIGYNKKRIFLGYFKTAEGAYAAYCNASKKYHGEFGRIK